MAETREIFTIVETNDGEGAPLLARTDGGQLASAGNHAGVLAFKNSDGNDTKPQLNANGSIQIVDENDGGTPVRNSGVATMAALNTEQDVIDIALGNDENIRASMAMGSSFQPTLWVLYHDDNSTLNELMRFVTGPGDFSHSTELRNIRFDTGSTGTQRLVLRATQIRGKLTDAHGTISAINFG